MSVAPLKPDQLYQATDPKEFKFKDTSQLDELTEIIGQPRAVEAVRFGTGMRSTGYNIFALGPPGTGKRSLIKKYFEQQAKFDPIPDDWCYIHNFEQEHKPKVISLPPGREQNFNLIWCSSWRSCRRH